MIRLTRTRLVMAVAVLALAAGPVLAITAPAWAVSPPICESSGNNYCVGAPTLGLGDPVKETVSGRDFNYHQGSNWNGMISVQLQFAADTSKCVGVADSTFNTTVKDCNTANNGTWWAIEITNPSTSQCRYVSEKYSGGGITWDLSGHNNLTQMDIETEGNGSFQHFASC